MAKLAGALKHHHIPCTVLDANLEGLQSLLKKAPNRNDTWTKVASHRLSGNLELLTSFVKDIHTTWRPRRMAPVSNAGTALNQSLDAKKRAYLFGLPGEE